MKNSLTETLNTPLRKKAVSRSARLAAACRRLQFETIKSIGAFWLIEKIPGLRIKEPWRKLYERSKR